MKKRLLAILLCMALAVSTMSLVACDGGNAYFNGDYQASSEEEITTFSQTVADNANATNIDWYKGYSIDFTMSGNMGGGDVNVDMDYKVGVKDDELAVAGNIELTDVAMTISGGLYYLDGYNYINGSVGVVGGASASGKYKQGMSYEDFLEEYGLDSVLIEDLAEVIPHLAMYDEINYFIDEGEETIKVKIEIPNQTITQEYGNATQTTTGSGTYVFVYDTEYNIIGFYAEMVSNSTYTSPEGSGQTTMSATLSIMPYEGAIELPSDLNTYLEI